MERKIGLLKVDQFYYFRTLSRVISKLLISHNFSDHYETMRPSWRLQGCKEVGPSRDVARGDGGTQMPSGVSLRERRKGGKTFCSCLFIYFVQRESGVNFSRVLIIQICFSYFSFMFICTILIFFFFFFFIRILLYNFDANY